LYFFCSAQVPFRINAGISIKERLPDSTFNLIMGDVYYDKNYNKLVYDLHFPTQQIWYFVDTNYYVIQDQEVKYQQSISKINKLTIFNLSLSGELKNYGLTNGKGYEITDIEKEEGTVYITWAPPKKYREDIREIIMGQRQNRLTGLVFLNSESEVIQKQFFENYITHNGVDFPQKLIQISFITPQDSIEVPYEQRREHYKIITFDDIEINESNNEKWYNYSLPDTN
jgi:hypothetical protein